MRRSSLLVAGVVTFTCVFASSGVAVAGEKEDTAAIAKIREMEAASVNDATSEHVTHIYAKDVKYLPPNEPALEGAEAVKAWLDAMIGQVDVTLEYNYSSVAVKGDMAFEQYGGVVTMTPKEGGETMTENVRGIHIYHKGKDGAWKITHDIWNTDAPAH
jgi:ketosteroid isomerase-like protein